MFCYNSNSSTSNPLAADIWNFVIVFNCTKSWKTRMKVFLSYMLRDYLNFNNCIGPNKSVLVGKNLKINKRAARMSDIQHLRVHKNSLFRSARSEIT